MDKRLAAALGLAAYLLVGIAGSATADGTIAADWRSQYPEACQTLVDATLLANDCILCHNPGSDTLNPYGWDLFSLNNNFIVAEGIESDGDGRTNGQEIILDCTLPGDVTSVPVDSSSWSAIKALFR